MRREKSLRGINQFVCIAGISVELFLDPNDYTFTATFQGEPFTDPALASLRETVEKGISASLDLPWQPVIQIQRGIWTRHYGTNDVPGENGLAFELQRFYAAQRADGPVIYCDWNTEAVERPRLADKLKFSGKNFDLPVWNGLSVKDSEYVWLPYTEDLWAGLLTIQAKLKLLRTTFDGLLKDSQGWKALAGGTLALEASVPE